MDQAPAWTLDQIAGLAFGVRILMVRTCDFRWHFCKLLGGTDRSAVHATGHLGSYCLCWVKDRPNHSSEPAAGAGAL